MSNRAARRREEREQRKFKKSEKPAVYNFTLEQLKSTADREAERAMKDQIAKASREVIADIEGRRGDVKKQATEDAVQAAMLLLFYLPLDILRRKYWKKTFSKKLPEFTEDLLNEYTRWQNGELDLNQAEAEIWRYGGMKFDESTESSRTEGVKVIPLMVSEEGYEGSVEVEKDQTRKGERYTLIMENPWGEGERLLYAYSLNDLKRKIRELLKEWRNEGGGSN